MRKYSKSELRTMKLPVKGPLASFIIKEIKDQGFSNFSDYYEFWGSEEFQDTIRNIIEFGVGHVY